MEGTMFNSSDSERGELKRRRIKISRTFYGAAAALAISIFLPWATVLGVVDVHLSGGDVVYLLAFAAVYAVEGYLVHHDRVTRTMLIGAWVVNAWMSINVFAIFSALGNAGGAASPALGTYAASLGVLAAIVATVQLQRSRRRAAIV
jgi:hypothetical protein